MALIVEDGTGLEDANSYCTVEFADMYFSERANVAWQGSPEQKEAALIQATDYIDIRFGEKFQGRVLKASQSLAFPRQGYVGIPRAVARATAEYALRALTTALAPDLVADPSGRVVTSTRQKVDVIETATTYSDTKAPEEFRSYPLADNLLRPFLAKATGRVIR